MRRFALLAQLSVLPAFAAVETTTVNGKVVLSDGSAATAGSITCTLSTPGTALDGSTSQRVAGSDTATIGSDGTITGLTLVPNDAITPTGTTYKCAFNVSSPRRVSWDETWSVATSPDPVNVGSITRYNVAPGITAGSFLLYVTNEPSGSCTSGETRPSKLRLPEITAEATMPLSLMAFDSAGSSGPELPMQVVQP